MPFKHACFISYRRGQGELVQTFIQELRKALEAYLEPYLDVGVFIDEGGLEGGDFFDPALACALCESICMILVYTPKYFDRQHSYCAREYKAMEKLERQRLKAIGIKTRGLIIPIIFRGPDRVPQEIRNKRHHYDFSQYTLVEPQIGNNANYASQIDDIAKRIYDFHQKFNKLDRDLCCRCNRFTLPSEDQIKDWLEGICNQVSATLPFPGREEKR